jgi:hypothetical protein
MDPDGIWITLRSNHEAWWLEQDKSWYNAGHYEYNEWYNDHDDGCNDVVVKSWMYPPVISQFDMENGPFSSVFLRIRNDFTIVVSSYQRSPWEIMMKWEPTELTNWKQMLGNDYPYWWWSCLHEKRDFQWPISGTLNDGGMMVPYTVSQHFKHGILII